MLKKLNEFFCRDIEDEKSVIMDKFVIGFLLILVSAIIAMGVLYLGV